MTIRSKYDIFADNHDFWSLYDQSVELTTSLKVVKVEKNRYLLYLQGILV